MQTEKADLGVQEVVPFLWVQDIQRSVAWYVDGVGFAFEQEWRPNGELKWCMIRLGGMRLMLQEHPPNRYNTDKGIGTTLCVFCEDAVDLYRRYQASGLDPREPFVGNRLWVTSLEDPDGYRIDFESPTDVPEETKLSDLEPM